ncbi:Transmembrane_domain-containing protein [Hexamita inflata]|uniref:Transmembrane domain-containing protein n=1 Tax=Hexamita inflata TaxID=28002 RepID=A0AA86PKK2_9EUKA|nr:Transmembrane domain-containing protein [Hexamita inflata]CAI9941670.1 Transmembrane domain-containing protein [Hexamita inflata]
MSHNNSEFGSDGWTSDSDSSCQSAEIDQQMRHYGDQNITLLLVQKFPMFALINILPALYMICEFIFVANFVDYENLLKLMELAPFIQIFSNQIQKALAQTCATLANKNILQQQIVAATIYYAYFIVACVLINVVSIIIGLTLVSSLYSTSEAKLYIIVQFCICPFINTFGVAQHSFWKIENRHALIFANQIVEFSVTFPVALFLLQKKMTGLNAIAIARIVAGVVQLIWSYFVVMRSPFLGVKYRGVLRLTFKRLSPFRPKFLIHVFTQALPIMVIQVTDSILYVTCTLKAKYQNLETVVYQTKIFRIQIIWLIKYLLEAFHKGFADVFEIIANYNLNLKKFRRIIQVISSSLVLDLIVGTILTIIFTAAAKSILRGVIPLGVPGLIDTDFQIQMTYNAAQYEAVASICLFWPLLVVTMLQLENRNVIVALVQIPKLIYGISFPFVADKLVGKNAPYFIVVAFGDAVSGVVGILTICYYIIRYKELARLEIMNEQVIEKQKLQAKSDDKPEQTAMVAVRQTITKMMEGEQVETRQSELQVPVLFRQSNISERQDMLRQSMSFSAVVTQINRESMARRQSSVAQEPK